MATLGPMDPQLSAPESRQERVGRGSGRLSARLGAAGAGQRMGKREVNEAGGRDERARSGQAVVVAHRVEGST